MYFSCVHVCMCVSEAEQIKLVSPLIVFTVSSTQSVISTQTAICPNSQLKTIPVLLTFAAIAASIHSELTLICWLFSPSACLPLYRHFTVSMSFCFVCSLSNSICLSVRDFSHFPSFLGDRKSDMVIINAEPRLTKAIVPAFWSVCSS